MLAAAWFALSGFAGGAVILTDELAHGASQVRHIKRDEVDSDSELLLAFLFVSKKRPHPRRVFIGF